MGKGGEVREGAGVAEEGREGITRGLGVGEAGQA